MINNSYLLKLVVISFIKIACLNISRLRLVKIDFHLNVQMINVEIK